MILEPAVETRPPEEQRALDDEAYRAQLAYVLERSPFYRDKLAGLSDAAGAGGLDDIARLPLTEKDELRASRTPGNPVGAHLCATRAEIVRIYSTSGTTGISPPISQASTTWLTVAPVSAATSVSAARRARVPAWSKAGPSGLSSRT